MRQNKIWIWGLGRYVSGLAIRSAPDSNRQDLGYRPPFHIASPILTAVSGTENENIKQLNNLLSA